MAVSERVVMNRCFSLSSTAREPFEFSIYHRGVAYVVCNCLLTFILVYSTAVHTEKKEMLLRNVAVRLLKVHSMYAANSSELCRI
jgi:hypothetical protein